MFESPAQTIKRLTDYPPTDSRYDDVKVKYCTNCDYIVDKEFTTENGKCWNCGTYNK